VNSDRGAGSVLTIALIAGVVALAGLAVPLYSALATRQAVAAAADASALAAADVAVGIAPGFPCAQAEVVASANGARLRSCELDGLIATVTVERSLLGIPAVASATAGPPLGESD
jgi:secretion/DNA translocation related TadE-like protein